MPDPTYATVTLASPLQVTLDSSDTWLPAVYLASYTLALGDRVAVQPFGARLLILGKVLGG